MVYVIILGPVFVGFLLVLGILGIRKAERLRRRDQGRMKAAAAAEVARLARDAEAHELNRSMDWEG